MPLLARLRAAWQVFRCRRLRPSSGRQDQSASQPAGTSARATETDRQMMARALALARQASQAGDVPVGAVVYETASGRILGQGLNRRQADRNPLAHAEVLAIEQAARAAGDWRLNHCTLVVTLEPCAMCAGLIVNARIGRLVYGAADPKAGAVVSLYRLTMDPRLNHRVEPIGGVLADECSRLLREFFQNLRRGIRDETKA